MSGTAPKVFRDPTAGENEELTRLIGVAGFNPTAVLRWFRQHPDVRANSFAHGNTDYVDTPIGKILAFGETMTPTHPLVQEVMSRNPNFVKKDENGLTLLQYMDHQIDNSDMLFERGYTAREPGDRKRKLREMIRKRMANLKLTTEALPTVESLVRQKGLPQNVGNLIASHLSGKTGTLKTQRGELQKQIGVPPKGGRRRRRKTRRQRKE